LANKCISTLDTAPPSISTFSHQVSVGAIERIADGIAGARRSSHVLSEVERVCDRIAMLRKGEVVLNSPVEDVRKLASRRVRVAFQQDVAIPASLPQGSEMIEPSRGCWR
jgi:ABC-type uncharacterized transport system ATPase subunit